MLPLRSDGIYFLLKVIQPLAQQPILPVVKQSVKERLGPVPASNIEPAEAQSASTEVVQVTYLDYFPKRW